MSKIKKINLIKSIRTKIVGMAIGCILAALIVTYVSIVPGARNSITDSSENNMLDLAKSYIKILNNSISAINETTISLESEHILLKQSLMNILEAIHHIQRQRYMI